MATVFSKLNLKDQKEILVLGAPASFEAELTALPGVTVLRDLKKVKKIDFALTFVITQQDLDSTAPAVASRAVGDAVVWFAYPKGSSKKYKSQISRDKGWKILGQLGFEPVRMIAIDEDWTSSRFRRVEFIKTMTRSPKYRLTGKP